MPNTPAADGQAISGGCETFGANCRWGSRVWTTSYWARCDSRQKTLIRWAITYREHSLQGGWSSFICMGGIPCSELHYYLLPMVLDLGPSPQRPSIGSMFASPFFNVWLILLPTSNILSVHLLYRSYRPYKSSRQPPKRKPSWGKMSHDLNFLYYPIIIMSSILAYYTS